MAELVVLYSQQRPPTTTTTTVASNTFKNVCPFHTGSASSRSPKPPGRGNVKPAPGKDGSARVEDSCGKIKAAIQGNNSRVAKPRGQIFKPGRGTDGIDGKKGRCTGQDGGQRCSVRNGTGGGTGRLDVQGIARSINLTRKAHHTFASNKK